MKNDMKNDMKNNMKNDNGYSIGTKFKVHECIRGGM